MRKLLLENFSVPENFTVPKNFTLPETLTNIEKLLGNIDSSVNNMHHMLVFSFFLNFCFILFIFGTVQKKLKNY
jgi:hypothetical protein